MRLGVLTALIAFGALSDRIGRRPVVAGSLIAIMVSMLLFASARSIEWLLAARLLQGVAIGTASTAVSAALIELQPSTKPGLGALAGAAVPGFGLAFGSLITGVLVDFGPAPTVSIYLALSVAFALAFTFVGGMPETSGQAGQVTQSWRPRRISVPRELRSRFVLLSIGTTATWAIGGFYLSLGPSLAAELLHSQQRAIGGAVVFALIGVGAFASLFVSNWTNQKAGYFGSICMVLGLLLVLCAVSVESAPLFFVGSVVLGTGWGPSYTAGFRAIAARAPPGQKAEVLTALFFINYLFFSLPAIVAGLVATKYGLHTATLIFGVVMMCMGVIASVGIYAAERTVVHDPKARAAPALQHEPCTVPCSVPHLVDCRWIQ